jgi:hypothetical protein
MINKLFFFISLIIFALINGCTQDSPLSDLDLTDPGLIKPDIEISKSFYSSGTISYSHTVWIYDKNNNSVNIQNGKVVINGIELSPEKELLDKAPYYSIDPAYILPFEFNKVYTCQITLSDGTVYSSTVKSRSVDIDSFVVPLTHDRTKDLLLKWSPVDPKEKIELSMLYNFSHDTSGGAGVREIQITNPQSGEVLVPKSYFDAASGVTDATFTLVSNVYGTTDSRFRPGSKIDFVINISKKTVFK